MKKKKDSKPRKKRSKAIVFTIIALSVLIVSAIAFFIVKALDKSSGHLDFYDGPTKAIKQRLIDPDSAEFRKISATTDGYCGELKSKNQFGVYSKYRRFYVRKDKSGKWLVEFRKDRVISACSP